MKLWLTCLLVALGAATLYVVIVNQKPATSPAVEESEMAVAITETGRTPVLVELFTSEGCSSCPPADDALARFERMQSIPGVEVIALAQHVDYWNRLGWSDPYSHEGFSQRQYDYARAFKKDGVYTPQMIVDGGAQFPGGNKELARSAISDAARNVKATIEITPHAGNLADKKAKDILLQVRVGPLPAMSAGDAAEVVLAITESNLYSDVSRGENAGRRLVHPSTVRSLASLGTANAQSEIAFAAEPAVTLSRGWRRNSLRAVIFVQERVSRRVLGASSVSLAAN